MEEKILNTIKKYNLIENGDSIVIGVSGGPDSICLLNILNEIKKDKKIDFNIYVAHINHMIREEAEEETQYVEEFCKKRNIPIFIKRANVLNIAKKAKKGTEETGRDIRYKFFEEVLKNTNSNKIVTAHNLNDKVETVLMNIIRGSGISGLKGIEPIRENKYIRPLIETERSEIEEYCKEKNLDPKIDKSNSENVYTRNKIRNKLIPYLKEEFNPNIMNAINKLSVIATDDLEYFERKISEINKVIKIEEKKDKIILDLKEFNKLELVIRRRVILYNIRELLGSTQGIEKIHIEDIIKLCSNNVGNKFLTPNKNLKIIVKNKKIFLIRNIDVP